MSVAKDQNGCRFLQRKFDEGGAAAIALVFPEVLDNLIELMVDPFGNYLIQKLLDRCSEEQRLQVGLGLRQTSNSMQSLQGRSERERCISMFERGTAHCLLADDIQVFLLVAVSNSGSEQMLLGLRKTLHQLDVTLSATTRLPAATHLIDQSTNFLSSAICENKQ